jgi:phosphoglycerol transferase MdoB-like AlkP superfamily enzyme
VKEGILGEPLYPWDLLSFRQALNMGPHYAPVAWVALAALGTLIVVALAVRYRKSPRPGFALLALGVATLWVVTATDALERPPFAARDLRWDVRGNIAANGPFLAFLINTRALLLARPAASATEAKATIDAAPTREALPGPRPDVVLLLVEAWMDPKAIGGNTAACIAPHLRHELQSPRFGGLTPNVEFEVLTGYPSAFIPSTIVPFQTYIAQPVRDALAWRFRGAGYTTVAAHNYLRKFWNRDAVLPLLGFERYVAIEDMPAQPYKGTFPDDALLFSAIGDELRRARERPRFIYGITVAMHGLYDGASRYPRREDVAPAAAAKLTADQRIAVGNYLAAVRDFEEALCGLLERLRESPNETIVFAFGDHWPTFGRDLAVFRELGIASGPDVRALPYAESLRMHRTPLVAWNNRRGDLPMRAPVVPAFALGSEVLGAAGLAVDGLWALELASYPRVASIACCWQDAEGKPFDFRDEPAYAALYRRAYDEVFMAARP